MTSYKVKFSTGSSPEVTKSDFAIGFRVVDLAVNKAWFIFQAGDL